MKLTCLAMRQRLAQKYSVVATTGLRKPKLVELLMAAADRTISPNTATSARKASSPAATTVVVNRARKRQANNNPVTGNTPTKRACHARAKYGQSHMLRRLRIRQRKADRAQASDEAPSKRQRLDRVGATTYNRQKKGYKTATQCVHTVRDHAHALYTLATKGDRRDDRQTEREGYNLLVFSQKQMCSWDHNAHVWKRGDKDMSLLHPNISECHDTNGWVCINTYLDGDGVVFLRPPPPMLVRGCGAQRRVRQFKWTHDQGVWLQQRTHHLGFKNINFPDLAREAEDLWGYSAPKQEHIENRIKGREKAKKERLPLPHWTTLWTPPP